MGQSTTQPGPACRLVEQQRTRRGDQRLAGGIENQIQVTATLHLRSPFPLRLLGLSQEQESQAGQALPCHSAQCRPLTHETQRLVAVSDAILDHRLAVRVSASGLAVLRLRCL